MSKRKDKDRRQFQRSTARTAIIASAVILVICVVLLFATMLDPYPASVDAAQRNVTLAWVHVPVWIGLGLSAAWLGCSIRSYRRDRRGEWG